MRLGPGLPLNSAQCISLKCFVAAIEMAPVTSGWPSNRLCAFGRKEGSVTNMHPGRARLRFEAVWIWHRWVISTLPPHTTPDRRGAAPRPRSPIVDDSQHLAVCWCGYMLLGRGPLPTEHCLLAAQADVGQQLGGQLDLLGGRQLPCAAGAQGLMMIGHSRDKSGSFVFAEVWQINDRPPLVFTESVIAVTPRTRTERCVHPAFRCGCRKAGFGQGERAKR